MMAFPVILRLKYKGKTIKGDSDRPEGVSIRAWRVCLKNANRAMAYHWHETFLPLHFGESAARRYPNVYQERTIQWLMKKMGIKPQDVRNAMPKVDGQKKSGKEYWAAYYRAAYGLIRGRGINYNVSSGTLKNMVQTVVFRTFPGRFRLEMPMPSYIPERLKKNTYKSMAQLAQDFGSRAMRDQPNIRAELTVMLPGEIDVLQRIGQRVLTQSMQQVLDSGRLPAGEVA